MLKGNKGEWSEIYTLLKIIADKNLFAGSSDLNKIENLIFPIIKVLRYESNGTYEYSYEADLVVIIGEDEEFRISIYEFRQKASLLLSKLPQSTSSTFNIPEIENFIHSFGCVSLKAKSGLKSDIRVVIHDQPTSTTPSRGFSIKSPLGGASTLLNAGKTTHFIFKIKNPNITETEIDQINAINSRSKIKDRLERINQCSEGLAFIKTESPIFGNDLTLIDYYHLIQGVTENNHWEAWLVYMLTAIKATAKETLNLINLIYELLQETIEKVKEKASDIYSRELVETLFIQPYCKISFLVDGGIDSRNTASKYLNRLVELNILEFEKVGNESLYLNKKLYSLLSQ